VPASLAGWALAGCSVTVMVRLNSRTGTEGTPVSSLNCDRPLHLGLVVPELVMGASCRITDEDTSLRVPPA